MTVQAGDVCSLAVALEAVLPYYDPVLIRKALSRLWTEQYECVQEAEGAYGLLCLLKAAGFELGLISNTWMPFYSGFCTRHSNLANMFDYTVLSFRLGVKKPSADIFRHALELCGKEASDCLLAGDSHELDINPAAGLGFQTAWVLSRPERERSTISRMLRGEIASPDLVACDLPELTGLMKERLGQWT